MRQVALAALLLLLGQQTAYVAGQYGDDDYGGEGGGGEDGGDEPAPAGDMQELMSVEEFDAFIDNDDVSVVGCFTDKEVSDPGAKKPEEWDDDEDGEWAAPKVENPVLSSLKQVSSSAYGYRFAFTADAAVKEKMKVKKNGVVLYKPPKWVSKELGDRPRERFPSETLSESAVSNWLATKSKTLVGPYTSSTKDRYKKATLVIFMNLDWEKNKKGVEYVLKRARKAAVGLKAKGLEVAIAPLADMKYELDDFGLTSTKPASDVLMGIRSPKPGEEYSKDYFPATGTFSAAAITSFTDDYLAGKLTAYVRPAEHAPADDDESPDDDAPGDGDDADEDKQEM